MSDRRLVVISAGLGQPSATRMLADRLTQATVRALTASGVSVAVETLELREYAHAITDHLLTGFADARLAGALDTIAGADALIAVSPTFNGSYSGLFKSFVDVLDEQVLADKPVLIGATGGTARHSLVTEHALRPLFSYVHAVVVPTAVYAATDDWGSTDSGSDRLAARVEHAGAQLAAPMAGPMRAWAAAERAPASTSAAPVAPVDPFAEPVEFAELLAAASGRLS